MSCYTTPHCVCCCTAGFNTLPLSRDCCIPLQQSHRPCVKHILNQCLFRLRALFVWVMQLPLPSNGIMWPWRPLCYCTIFSQEQIYNMLLIAFVAHCVSLVCCSLRLLLIAFRQSCLSATQRSTPTHRIARYILMTTDVVPLSRP